MGCSNMGRDAGFPSFTLFSWPMVVPPSSSWIMVMDGENSSSKGFLKQKRMGSFLEMAKVV
uniref:Uncharacterized protein n=1 Tax=Arundo donax TaxID=35708 RepID=A0A0A8YCK8_ARUDO